MALATLDWMTQDAERLAQCNHDHPQAVLGPQQLEDGSWVVRVWMPDASRVVLLHQGHEHVLENPHHAWVFEAELSSNPGSQYRCLLYTSPSPRDRG